MIGLLVLHCLHSETKITYNWKSIYNYNTENMIKLEIIFLFLDFNTVLHYVRIFSADLIIPSLT